MSTTLPDDIEQIAQFEREPERSLHRRWAAEIRAMAPSFHPVDQRITDTTTGMTGDCMSACIASVLGLGEGIVARWDALVASPPLP